MQQYQLIQVRYKFVPKGSPIRHSDEDEFKLNSFQNFDFPEKPLEEVNYKGETKENHTEFLPEWSGGYFIAPTDFEGFDFTFVGKKYTSDHFSGIDYAYENDVWATFESFLPTLRQIAQNLLNEERDAIKAEFYRICARNDATR